MIEKDTIGLEKYLIVFFSKKNLQDQSVIIDSIELAKKKKKVFLPIPLINFKKENLYLILEKIEKVSEKDILTVKEAIEKTYKIKDSKITKTSIELQNLSCLGAFIYLDYLKKIKKINKDYYEAILDKTAQALEEKKYLFKIIPYSWRKDNEFKEDLNKSILKLKKD
jgi:hypothetical protein